MFYNAELTLDVQCQGTKVRLKNASPVSEYHGLK